MKTLTFTVPCYNSAGFMSKCIDSLLIGGPAVEIIIIDDGSKDETGAIADRYAEKYPDIVRVIHQENGGHGEGINQGLKHATGRYFKVVDSDDWVDSATYRYLLDKLPDLPEDCDLILCDYTYRHDNPSDDHTMQYRNIFKPETVMSWEQAHPFLLGQVISLHNCIYSTEMLRNAGTVLPKHCFYEDNYFVYQPLPHVRRLCYVNKSFYQYYVTREGQSVSRENISKHYKDQVRISTMIFKEYDLHAIQEEHPGLAKYMWHVMTFMVTIAAILCRNKRDDESEAVFRQMWKDLYTHDKRRARRVRWCSSAFWVSFPGKAGRAFCNLIFRIAHLFVKFN